MFPTFDPSILVSVKSMFFTFKNTNMEREGSWAFEGKLNMSPLEVLVDLRRHEHGRVFCDQVDTDKVQSRDECEQ